MLIFGIAIIATAKLPSFCNHEGFLKNKKTDIGAFFLLVSLIPYYFLPTTTLQAYGGVELVCQECSSQPPPVPNPAN